jgi:uncharacterized protein (TIGR02001 family)
MAEVAAWVLFDTSNGDRRMKMSIGAVAVAAVMVTPLVGAAQAEVSANVGWVSEYFYRGLLQKPAGSSASAGLDVEGPNAYLGTWAADVGDGNEVDVYAGVGTEMDEFSVSVGGTGYFYTGGFDDTYLEANLNAGYGPLSAEYSYGRYKAAGGDEDYWFLAFTVEEAGLYATFGTFGKDFSGEYFEGGYGLSVGELDLTASWIYATEDLNGGGPGSDDHTLVFGVGHTFGLN